MTNLQPFQQRVVAERDELAERTEKLLAFIDSEAFKRLGLEEQHRMREQSEHMLAYGNILARRIENFTGPDDVLLVFNAHARWACINHPERGTIRVAMDARQLGDRGIPACREEPQHLQQVTRRDFEAGEQFKDVVLL